MDQSKPGAGAESFLARWHTIVAERDLVALREVLAEDVTMGAPPYWQKMQGRDLVHHLLGLIINTIEGFTYHREWVGARSADGNADANDGESDDNGTGNSANEIALEFTGKIGKLDLHGVDLITLNADGKIQNLDVVLRPENAIGALREVIAPQMMAFIQAKGQGKMLGKA